MADETTKLADALRALADEMRRSNNLQERSLEEQVETRKALQKLAQNGSRMLTSENNARVRAAKFGGSGPIPPEVAAKVAAARIKMKAKR